MTRFCVHLAELIKQQEKKQAFWNEQHQQISAAIDAVWTDMLALQQQVKTLQELKQAIAASSAAIQEDFTQQLTRVLMTTLGEMIDDLTVFWAKSDNATQMETPYLFYYDPDEEMMGLVLPLPEAGAGAAPLPNYAGALFHDVLLAMFKFPKGAWDDEIELCGWNGFTAIRGKAYDFDMATLMQGVNEAFKQQVIESGLLKNLTPSPIPISKAVWVKGLVIYEIDDVDEETESAESFASRAVMEESEDQRVEDETAIQTADDWVLPGAWYSPKDVQSWSRPLRTTSSTGWGRESRMVRTLLIRMIEKGFVDDHFIAWDHLWMGLPYAESQRMKSFAEQLISQNVLRHNNKDETVLVSVNSAYWNEIEVIINRTLNDFWKGIIFAPEPLNL